jgi:predicted phage replisome organizer
MPEIKWIKLTTDMFDDDKIKLIKKMPDADTLLIIWIKLICQAGRVNDRGAIYITPSLPYNEENLAAVLEKEIKVVRLALNVFKELQMIDWDIESGRLILVNFEKHQNIDGMEHVKELSLKRQHIYRDKKQLQAGNVTVTLRNALDKIRLDKNREEKEEDGLLFKLIDEKRYDEIQIGHETLASIIRCLNNEQPCNETNKRLYREQLEKLKIEPASIGIKNLL